MAKALVFLGLLLATAMVQTAYASDPDLTTDYDVKNATVNDFIFKAWEYANTFPGSGIVTPYYASFDQKDSWTGIHGLGLAAVLFHFGPASQIDPHVHPRASEFFHVIVGEIQVGFVDTANNLFETTLKVGDLFVFPKGMLHYQRNNNASAPAAGVSVLNAEKPGIIGVAKAMFAGGGKGFPDNVITSAFGISPDETGINDLKEAVAYRNKVTLDL